MSEILAVLFIALIFSITIFISMLHEKKTGNLKIRFRYIILIPLFCGILMYLGIYNIYMEKENKKAEEIKVVLNIVENFKKNNKEVLTVKEQEKIISEDFKNNIYLKQKVRISFLEKSIIVIVKSLDDNDYFCKKIISDLSKLDSNRYKIMLNYKNIKDVLNNNNEMKNICNRNKETIIQIY